MGTLVAFLLYVYYLMSPIQQLVDAASEYQVGAAAVDYLRVVGHMCFAYFFAQAAKIALAKKDSGDPFYTAKLATARFYFAKLLPETAGLIRSCRAGAAPLMAMDEALF